MNVKYITSEHTLYQEAKAIRIQCFFEGLENAEQLIHDQFEKEGFHLIYLNEENQVLGTGRLNIEVDTGIISQMAIAPEHQGKGIGGIILDQLIIKSKSMNITQIRLSARLTAQSFYQKRNFQQVGEVYPSKKTGIMHVNMILVL
ncbi:GNAT family N-acetyltransferase [Flammeovirga sp. SJP92]|uniref:GNAT family N-acetyltransferase n=1 Tax=Flammeovirga sp. SJP92 TaxID=1775430 RepID=UPI0007890E27|nr:GNAT family N-acetyltransferase [Flammeovirga sp. SJP92]KXX66589.1 hypothetical protein AVL50_31325 [Flammeovirga sp. SJP92]